jgi:hypothetical protein
MRADHSMTAIRIVAAACAAAALALLCAAGPVSADPITGYQTWSWNSQGYCTLTGPELFGSLPEEGDLILEAATRTDEYSVVPSVPNTTVTLELPQYGDGTTAPLEDVFFTVQPGQILTVTSTFLMRFTWDGGPTLTIYQGGPTRVPYFRVTTWAMRTQSMTAVGEGSVERTTFGRVKTDIAR